MKKEIREAFSEIIRQRDLDDIPETRERVFRDGFYRETLQLAKERERQKKKYIMIGKRAVSKTAVFILALFLLCGITAYAMWSGLAYKVFERNTEIQPDSSTGAADQITSAYIPVYLPDGYTLQDDQYISDTLCSTTFKHGNGSTLTLVQQADVVYNADSENTAIDFVSINGNEGYFFIKNDHATLIWPAEGCIFELVGYPAIPLSEMIKVAESIIN